MNCSYEKGCLYMGDAGVRLFFDKENVEGVDPISHALILKVYGEDDDGNVWDMYFKTNDRFNRFLKKIIKSVPDTYDHEDKIDKLLDHFYKRCRTHYDCESPCLAVIQ